MQVKCLNVNYYDNGTTNYSMMPETPVPGGNSVPVAPTHTFSGSVTFADGSNTANTFQITFTSLTEYLPYLPGKTYSLDITEAGSAG